MKPFVTRLAAVFHWYYCPQHGWYYNTGDCALCVEAAEGRAS